MLSSLGLWALRYYLNAKKTASALAAKVLNSETGALAEQVLVLETGALIRPIYHLHFHRKQIAGGRVLSALAPEIGAYIDPFGDVVPKLVLYSDPKESSGAMLAQFIVWAPGALSRPSI